MNRTRNGNRDQSYQHLSVPGQIIVFGSILFIFAVLAIYQIYQFDAWGQITLLYSYHAPFLDLVDHPHFFRYFVTYPGLWAEDYWGYGWFSAYISMFMIGSAYFIYRICRGFGFFYVVMALALIMPFHAFMNGRGVLSWFGWILVIFLIRKPIGSKYSIFEILLFIVAALCSSVSTGTFVVVFSAVIISFAYRFFKSKYKQDIFIIVLLSTIFSKYFIVSFSKNIDFYDYGDGFMANMLSHGLGGILSQNITLLLGISIILMISPFVFDFIIRNVGFIGNVILITPLIGGIFGFTTLTLAVPALVLMLVSRFKLVPADFIQGQRTAFKP